MAELSIVVPVYCEERNLPLFLERLHATVSPVCSDFEIIVVDDGSTDATWPLLQQASERYPELTSVRLSRNFGKENAICAGLERAEGDAVVLIDGDFEHPPELIPDMLSHWRAGEAEVIEGVKTHRGQESRLSRFGARAFYAALRVLSGFDLKDHTDFKLLDRTVLEAWNRMGERNLFFRGMVKWLGFRCMRLGFDVSSSERESRWSFLQLFRLATTGLTSFSSLPLHLVSGAGLLVLPFALGLLIHTLWMKLSGRALDGFTTVISLQLLIGCILMLGLGVIGTYLGRIHDEVKARPRYVIAEQLRAGEKPSLQRPGRRA